APPGARADSRPVRNTRRTIGSPSTGSTCSRTPLRVAIPAASTTAATARSSPGPRLPAPYATVSAPLHVAALFVHRLRCALGADLPCSLGGSILAPVPPAPRQTLPRFGRVS